MPRLARRRASVLLEGRLPFEPRDPDFFPRRADDLGLPALALPLPALAFADPGTPVFELLLLPPDFGPRDRGRGGRLLPGIRTR